MNIDYAKEYRLLGLNISFYRKLRGYTQIKLAEKLEIERSHLSGIELGNHAASLDLIFKICRELEITEKELFDFK